MRIAERLVRPALLALDPETAHKAAVALLRWSPVGRSTDPGCLAVEAFGLRFPNPVGLAAGFDKNGELGGKATRFGFGFTEVGTVTPRPQAGNPRPRVFRLVADRAVVNRYGFNNDGHAAVHARLAGRRSSGLVGVNVGANKDASDRVADYVAGLEGFADVASFFTLNVSSPNTPGLRDLQSAEALDDLLARALAARDGLSARHGRKPVLLKIAPDLDLYALDAIVAVARRRRVDGLIVSNTTLARPGSLRSTQAGEGGGLSGGPLFEASTRLLAQTFLRVDGQFPLVGAGGIDSPERALAKIRAGATLIQLYSGLVYEGLGLVMRIKEALTRATAQDGTTLAAFVGRNAQTVARV